MAIEPDQQQFADVAAIAGADGDGPVVMLNLNRYRDRAAYENGVPGGQPSDVSGQEAYLRYGAVAQSVLDRLGGKILWHTESERTVIGDETDRYDEVIAVWYPNYKAFAALVTDPDLVDALPHRVAALERAAVICCNSGEEAVLAGINSTNN
jgi:uncharacterized protein (DUF1330 family)